MCDAHLMRTEKALTELRDPVFIERSIRLYRTRYAYYDVIELTRKVGIVGMVVLIRQGEYLQLVIGATLAGITLALISWSRPYKWRTSNYLAAACQLVVLLNLLVALLLKGHKDKEQLEECRAKDTDDVRRALREARDEYEAVASFCGGALILLYACPLLMAAGLIVRDARTKEVWQEVSRRGSHRQDAHGVRRRCSEAVQGRSVSALSRLLLRTNPATGNPIRWASRNSSVYAPSRDKLSTSIRPVDIKISTSRL